MKIPQPKYLLREPKNNDKTQINLVVRYDNNKFVYNTGERVHPQYWDFNKQQVKKATSFPEYTDINQWLNKLEDHIISIFRELRINKMEIDNSILKDEMDKRLNISKKKDEVTLFSFIENYIETNKKLKSEGTIKVYQTSYNHLIKFQEQYKTKINFKTIDLTFYDSLMNYFLNELKYSSNTAGKYIKTLKVFLNEATERGLNETIYYKSKKFKRLSMDTDKIYLTETELLDLYNLTNLEKNEELIRDLFILSSYTGLRFSDIINIKKENIQFKNNTWYMNITTKKTREAVIIPLNDLSKNIVKKYNYSFNINFNNQTSNRILKELSLKAGLTSEVIINESIGGVLVSNVYKKFELVSWHAARRSFATNSYKAGVPTVSIMKCTGHQTEKVFLEYIRISNEENAELLIKEAFFN